MKETQGAQWQTGESDHDRGLRAGSASPRRVGLLALGGRAWFNRPVTCVMAFDDSVAGLSVGAPVAFRGVPLGTVTTFSSGL